MKKNLLILLALSAISCESNQVEPNTLDFVKFTIQVPGTWTAVPQQGYDSFVGEIEMTDAEKVSFDLGGYTDKLNVDPVAHDIYFVTIDDKRAKVVRSKDFGRGTTGVYFDSLETTKSIQFQISGTGLSTHNQTLFLTAIRTLKFKN